METSEMMVEYQDQLYFHPGYYLLEELDELNISQNELASRLGISPKVMSDILNGKTSLTVETASKISAVLGTSALTWLNLQNQFDIAKRMGQQSLTDEMDFFDQYVDKSFFFKLGVLVRRTSKIEQIKTLQTYLKVSSLQVFNGENTLMSLSYRKNTSSSVDELKQIVRSQMWVQTAINQATEKLSVTPIFNRQKLETRLKEIRALLMLDYKDFYPKLVNMLSECGVIFTVLPNMSSSGVHGVVKWLQNDKVMLAISDRGKMADKIWFSIFHELGHVLQERKKLTILSTNAQDKLEKEADEFASEMLLSASVYQQFVQEGDFSEQRIIEFSKAEAILPAILVGRLQLNGLIAYHQYNHLRNKYQF